MVEFDDILDEFERLWREGHKPQLGPFVDSLNVSGEQHREILAELIAVDLEYRWRTSCSLETASNLASAIDTDPHPNSEDLADEFPLCPTLADYAKRWPELFENPAEYLDLVVEEYRIRHRFGDRPPIEDYYRQYGDSDALRQSLVAIQRELVLDGNDESQEAARKSTEEFGSGAEATVAVFDSPRDFGRYKLLKQLGRGGMGEVYLAHDTHLDRQVALKMPHLDDSSPQVRERFINEARTAATLRHPHICPVFDAGEIEGQPFLTMAYLEGKTLHELRREGQTPSPAQITQILAKIAQALQAAHNQGIVHRDLKPANVMIESHGEPVVMDFGLAFRASKTDQSRITQTGDTMGSPAFMSPEQVEARRDEIGPATDIYSLGVMLFQMLTGRLPFTGSLGQIMAGITRDPPPNPSDLKDNIDPELEQLCLQMLAKHPTDRPTSMTDVANRLTAIQRRLETEPATPTADSSPAKASSNRKPTWKKRSALALAALGIVLALGYIVFRIQTPYGTVTIEVASEAAKDVQVRVLKEGKVIEVADASSGWSLRLQEGEYEFDLGQAEASFSISPRTVRISEGETEIVKVAIAANTPRKAGETKDTPKPKIDLASVMDEKDFALSFDGQDDYVEIPTLTYDGSHPLTIEAWITTYSLPSYAGIIGNKTRSGEPGGLSLMILSLLGERFWHVGVNGASAKGRNAYIWPSDERFEKVVVGKRTHIAGVWDGQRLTLFVNGWKNDNMVSDRAKGSVDRVDLIPSAASFLFGAEIPGKLHFEGAIDEVRFSKSVRYRKDFTPPESFKSDEQTLALYHFEEGSGDVLKDTSGHGHHGKIHGALWVPGPTKSALPEHDAAIAAAPREDPPALFFDGTHDYVHIPYAPVDGRPPLTIEAWIRPEADKARWGKGLQGYIVSTAGWATGLGLAVGGPMEVMGANIAAPDNQNIGDAVQRPELEEWSHVAAVWTDDALQFYWNGRLKKEWPLDYNQIPSWSSWRLGRRGDDTPIGFRGAMREVRISTVARYKDHFRPQWRFEPDEQTLGLYHFEEGSGDVLIDSSGQGRYGRHGRIVGAKWTPSKAEVPLEENRALSFDGVDDHVITPIVYDGSHPITVEAWVAAADPWEWGTIISNDTGHPNGFTISHESYSHNPIWHGLVFGGDSTQPLAGLYRRPDYEPKTHLAMVWDGEEYRLYVNGETQQSTISPLKKMPGSRERIRLGTRLQAGVLASEHWHRFHGLMDEVRISKVARYDAKFQPSNRFEPDEDTLALYHCDEADSDILKDSSANGNDARIYGGATRKLALEMHSPSEYYRQLDDWIRLTARKMPERSGPALEFSTTNAHVEIPAVEFDFTKPFTVEAWATPEGNWTPNSPSREVVRLGDLELKIDPNSKIWTFHSWDGRGLWAGPWGKDMMLWNRRTHVVGQWDGKQMKLFLNGIPCPGEVITFGSIDNLQEFIHAQLATANGHTIRIGSYDQEGGTFGGTIDRFRLSRGARYDEPFDPTDFKADDSTIVMFDFREGKGDVLHDLSGNGYHGKIVGAKWVPAPDDRPTPLPGLVAQPAEIEGVHRWQMVTRWTRANSWAHRYSPDGKWYAVVGCDGYVRIFEGGPQGRLHSMAWVEGRPLLGRIQFDWAPDSRRFVTHIAGRGFRVWNIDGTPLHSWEGEAQNMAWAPDDEWIAAVHRGVVQLWRPDGTPGPLLRMHDRSYDRSVSWSPDGERLVATSGSTVIVWKDDGDLVRTLPVGSSVRQVHWSPDGKRIACVMTDGSLEMWEPTGRLVNRTPSPYSWKKMGGWSPDGRSFAAATRGVDCELWDRDGRPVWTATSVQNLGMGSKLTWSPDGSRILLLKDDRSIRAHAVDDGRTVSHVQEESPRISGVAWNKAQTALATSGFSQKSLRLFDSDGIPRGDFIGRTWAYDVGWHHSGDAVFVCSDGGLRRFRTPPAEAPRPDGLLFNQRGDLRVLATHPTRDLLAVAVNGSDKLYVVAADGKVVFEPQEKLPIESMAFSPDGRWLAASIWDRLVVWDTDKWESKKVRQGKSRGVSWSSDSRRLATVAENACVKVFDLDGRVDHTIKIEHVPNFSTGGLGWSPDDRWIAWSRDNLVLAVEFESGRQHTFPVHVERVEGLVWTAANQVVAAGYDGLLSAWNVESGECLWTTVYIHGTRDETQSVTIAPNGAIRHADDGAADRLVYVVEREPGRLEVMSRTEFGKGFPAKAEKPQRD